MIGHNENQFIPGVKKIAVLRANSLGDAMFVLPALQALRETYPRAEIVYLGSDVHVQLFQNRLSTVDRAITIPQTEGVLVQNGRPLDMAAQKSFFQQMRKENFDLAFQMHGGGRYSNPFVCNLNPRISIGAKDLDAPPLDRWIPYIFYQHEIIRNLEIAALSGARTTELEPHLPLLPSDLQAAEPVLRQIRRPFIVVHPGSTDSRRRWEPASFAQVADRLTVETGLQVVLTGVEDEAEHVQAVLDAMHEPAINLCGALTLEGMIGLLSQAELMIANNTGPLYVMLALGGKAAGLFYAESIVNSLPFTRSNFYPLIAWDRRCPVCGKYCDKEELDNRDAAPCHHDTSFLNEIKPQQVVDAAHFLLGHASS